MKMPIITNCFIRVAPSHFLICALTTLPELLTLEVIPWVFSGRSWVFDSETSSARLISGRLFWNNKLISLS